MKVLKKGSENLNFGKKFYCDELGLGKGHGGCGALLLVVPADVVESSTYIGSSYYWICPECGCKNRVAHDDFH